jgi:hypothetical protein
MGRCRAESIEVWRQDDMPVQFRWRDRRYQVREVLAYWREAEQWWRSLVAVTTGDALGGPTADVDGPPAGVDGPPAGVGGPGPPAVEGFTVVRPPPRDGRHASAEPAPGIAAAVGLLAVDDRMREFWRVEAVPERTPNSGIYDLCFDWSGGHWHLIRVED